MRGKRVLTLGRRSLDSKNQHKSNKSNVNISINPNYNKLEKLNSNSNFITKTILPMDLIQLKIV